MLLVWVIVFVVAAVVTGALALAVALLASNRAGQPDGTKAPSLRDASHLTPSSIVDQLQFLFRSSVGEEARKTLNDILARGRKTGVVVWSPPNYSEMFEHTLTIVLPDWLNRAGITDVVFDRRPEEDQPDFTGTDRVLVCVLHRLVAAGAHPAEYIIGLGTEHLSEIKLLEGLDSSYNSKRLFIHFSPGFVRRLKRENTPTRWPIMALPHLWWSSTPKRSKDGRLVHPWDLWPNDEKFQPSITAPVSWMFMTKRRSVMLQQLDKLGMPCHNVYTSGRSFPKSIVNHLRKHHVLLNMHAYTPSENDGSMLEMHRITHPFVRHMTIMTEASIDSDLERILLKAGILHSVVGGQDNPAGLVEACRKTLKQRSGETWANNVALDPRHYGFQLAM